jgi:hypothetical protein
MSVRERVARGGMWLDEIRPGWRDALALGALEIAHGGQCILGQVFSDDAARSKTYDCGYTFAMNVIVTRADWVDCPHWSSAHGFDSGGSLSGDEVTAELAALEDEWRRMIHMPRDEFASPVLSH